MWNWIGVVPGDQQNKCVWDLHGLAIGILDKYLLFLNNILVKVSFHHIWLPHPKFSPTAAMVLSHNSQVTARQKAKCGCFRATLCWIVHEPGKKPDRTDRCLAITIHTSFLPSRWLSKSGGPYHLWDFYPSIKWMKFDILLKSFIAKGN